MTRARVRLVALLVATVGLSDCSVHRPFCETAADHAPASAQDAPAKYGEVVVEAVGCGGNLWLRTRNNGNFPDSLWIIEPETGRLVDSIPGGVVDIHRSGTGDAYALVRRSVNAGRTTRAVVKRVPSGFVDAGAFDIGDAAPLGIGEDQKQPYVITDRNVYERANDGTWMTKALSPPLTETYGTEVAIGSPSRGGSAYVGLDRGEWGGGLLRIDLPTGSVTAIGRGDTFTSIVADPRSPDCVLARVGLEHMDSREHVLEVCGRSREWLSNRNWSRLREHLFRWSTATAGSRSCESRTASSSCALFRWARVRSTSTPKKPLVATSGSLGVGSWKFTEGGQSRSGSAIKWAARRAARTGTPNRT